MFVLLKGCVCILFIKQTYDDDDTINIAMMMATGFRAAVVVGCVAVMKCAMSCAPSMTYPHFMHAAFLIALPLCIGQSVYDFLYDTIRHRCALEN